MKGYINKSAAMSVCNTQRAYGTMQIIQDLPCAKVVDREQFRKASEEVCKEHNAVAADVDWWFKELENKGDNPDEDLYKAIATLSKKV